MITAYLAPALAFLKRVPWQVWLVLAVLLTGLLWGNHRYSQGVADTEAKYAAIAAQALQDAREADEAAQTTVNTENASVADSNAAAREAAANSDDPLAAALESIRSSGATPGSGPAR